MAKTFSEQLVDVIKNKKISTKIKKNKIDFLIKLGADVNFSADVLLACDDIEMADFLVSKGFDVDIFDEKNEPLIVRFVKENNVPMVKFLIEKNAKLNALGATKTPALSVAISNKNDEIMNLLLENKCDINQKGYMGFVPLMYACKFSNKKAVEELLKRGANIDAREYMHGLTSLMMVEDGKIAKMLIDAGAKVNDVDNLNASPLMRACNKDVAEVLIANGANIQAKDNEGKTALVYAIERELLEVVESLIKHGADIKIVDKFERVVKGTSEEIKAYLQKVYSNKHNQSFKGKMEAFIWDIFASKWIRS